MHEKIINLANLGDAISKIEALLEEEGMNITEQQLVLQQTLARLETRIKKTQVDDLVNSNPIIKIAKKFMPKEED